MKIIIITSLLFLSGCFQGWRYDNIELMYAAEIKTMVERIECRESYATHQAEQLDQKAHSFMNFSEYSSGGETFKMTQGLKGLTGEFNKRYQTRTPSKTYCELKVKNILRATELISKSVGGKIR